MGEKRSNANGSWQGQSRKQREYDRYYDYGAYHGYGRLYGEGYRNSRFEIDIHQAVEPLIRQIKIYDNARQKLEKQGGTIIDLASLVAILSKEIRLKGDYGETKVALRDPVAVRSALFDIDYRLGYRLRLQVRELRSGMPGYYICRTVNVYLPGYNSLIVEDLYCSPGYPIPDKRFVRLMKNGKEESFLRLAPFRADIKKGIQDDEDQNRSMEHKTDRILYNLGRYVLGPAWHEDQFPGMQAADHLKLRYFPQVIELLYLELSGELCELRSQIDEDMLEVFQTMIPNPSILGFLKRLRDLNGAELSEIPKEGLAHYVSLQKAFSQFLSLEIPWGRRKAKMPLNVLLIGNFSRLDLVGKALSQSKNALKAKKRLEDQAQKIISLIIQKKRKVDALLGTG